MVRGELSVARYKITLFLFPVFLINFMIHEERVISYWSFCFFAQVIAISVKNTVRKGSPLSSPCTLPTRCKSSEGPSEQQASLCLCRLRSWRKRTWLDWVCMVACTRCIQETQCTSWWKMATRACTSGAHLICQPPVGCTPVARRWSCRTAWRPDTDSCWPCSAPWINSRVTPGLSVCQKCPINPVRETPSQP